MKISDRQLLSHTKIKSSTDMIYTENRNTNADVGQAPTSAKQGNQ